MKNKLRIILLAGLSTFAAYSASAEYNCWYVSAAGTMGWQNCSKFNIVVNDKVVNDKLTKTDEVSHDTTLGGSLAIGHIINNWRVELEGSYRQNKLEDKLLTTLKDNKKHDIRSGNLSFMANAYYDIPVTEVVSFYLGAGAGVSFVYGQNYTLKQNVTPIKEKLSFEYTDTVFAWQGMAGITFALTECIDLYGGYRVFATTKPIVSKSCITDDKGTLTKTKFVSKNIPVTNNVEVGIRFKF